MSLETPCDHTPRKSGKNMFSKHLRQVNTQLFRLNGKGAKVTSPETLSQVTSLHFDRLVLKLVPRELDKFMQLLTYFASDPHYDSVDVILGFTRENYISRRNIHQDDEPPVEPPVDPLVEVPVESDDSYEADKVNPEEVPQEVLHDSYIDNQ